jgi:adenosylhomocysteine nucleosidase
MHTRRLYGLAFGIVAVATLLLPPVPLLAQAPPRPPAPVAVPSALPADIVIQGAMDSELQPLLAALEDREQIQIAAWTFWRGRLGGLRVVVSRTEGGPINAAAATTLAIVNFRPRFIINQGTAGANDPELKLFDIVVGEATVDYGAFRSSRAEAGAGIDQARWTPAPHRLRLVVFKNFPGDGEMIAVTLATPYSRGRLVKGIIGSAFEFNKELDRLSWVRKTYGAISEDMESAFAAGVAMGFGTRFVAIRIISDSPYNAPDVVPAAGEYCAAFVVDVVKRLRAAIPPAPPTTPYGVMVNGVPTR